MLGGLKVWMVLYRVDWILCVKPSSRTFAQILEYNCLIWNPYQEHSINLLENLQRNFSKRIPSLSHLTYFERLDLLNLVPLELRRLRFDLNYYYKTLHNLTLFNPDTVYRIYTPREASRSNSPYLQKPNNANTTLLSSFFYTWNYLPSNLRHAPSTSAFKIAVKCIDFSRFLKGSSVSQTLTSFKLAS
jgi:hypothetical protein